jgi:hypothetical protein
MFSIQQKRDISDAVQKVLRATMHPELPVSGEISFLLHVDGAESWSFADIQNNGAVGDPGMNPHNELMASIPEKEARGLIEEGKALSESAIGFPDPRATPEEFYKEMITGELNQLGDRVRKIEAALGATADSDANALLSLPDRLRNLETAIRQLGNQPKET